jgi:hypothetical protein
MLLHKGHKRETAGGYWKLKKFQKCFVSWGTRHATERSITRQPQHTYASEGLPMHQQQEKAAISSLSIFLTPDDGHVGQNM